MEGLPVTITFTIPGEPEGKGRPRFARVGNAVRTFTPEKTRAYEDRVRLAYRSAAHGMRFGDKPVMLTVTAYYATPASASRKRQDALIGTPCTKKPDADNVLKAIADALNGVAYDDDKQVAVSVVEKRWEHYGRVDVAITDCLPIMAARLLQMSEREREIMNRIAKEET